MGKVIRGCRKGKGSVFKSHTTKRIGAVNMRKWDFAEKNGYVKGVVKKVRSLSVCDPKGCYLTD